MSFGAQMRFEVKNGSKGIFWQTEKPKQSQKKFGYKTKQMTHSIRKPEQPYLEEPLEPVKPSQDFIKKNRMQFKPRASPGDKENISRNTTRSDRSSSEIKPGTVTLTQEQLNALLSTVGKFNGGDGGKLRISIDAENNRLEVETPRDNADSGPNSYRSGGDVEAEASLFDLVKNGNENHSGPNDHRDSSGYNSEDKSHGGNKVRFDTARNVERHKSPDPIPPTPALVPWKHMTLGERKRLQWAREKAAADEEEQKKHSKTQGGGGAPSSAPVKPEEYDPWGRPGAGAPQRKAEPEPAPVETSTGFKSKNDEELRSAIDAIEAKYGPMLNGRPEEYKETMRSPPGRQSDQASEKGSYAGIPGLDPSYSPARASKPPKSQKHLEDRGNSRPSRKQDDDRERDRKEKPSPRTRQGGSRKSERWRREEEERQRREEEERGRRAEILAREEAERKAAGPAGPAAMQSSLFMGQSEPDNTRFLTKKEQEKKNWLEELDRQREDKRVQKQREKDSRRGGGEADDKWADRFVPEGARRGPPASQQRDHAASSLPYASGGNYAVGGGGGSGGGGGYEDRPAVRGQPGAPYLPGNQPSDDRPAGRQHYPQQHAPPPFASGGTYGDSSEQRGLPPAAMRSSIAMGDAAPNLDKIQQQQVDDKKLWLEELNKQRDAQRDARMRLKEKQSGGEDTWAQRFTSDPRTNPAPPPGAPPAAGGGHSPRNFPPSYQPPSSYQDDAVRTSSAPQPAVGESFDDATHIRGQNVQMDTVTRRELEDKRRKHLEYQAAIKAQIEEKEKQKQNDRERKWREEVEEERKLKAERDFHTQQLVAEDSKNRQKEEARTRQTEHLKVMMDQEQQRAQEQRMIKRLTTLQHGGHDVTGLKAHYEAISPRLYQPSTVVDPASIPGLQVALRDNPDLLTLHSPRGLTSTYRAGEVEPSGPGPRPLEAVTFEPYQENRVLTPSRFRQSGGTLANHRADPLREFATQTDEGLELALALRKENSDVEIEYRQRPGDNSKDRRGQDHREGPRDYSNDRQGRDGPGNYNSKDRQGHKSRDPRSQNGYEKEERAPRVRSAERRKPAAPARGQPPVSKTTKKRAPEHPLKGKANKWNYQNPKKKAPVKQSEKDLFYDQKKAESDERRAKREKQLQYLVELNKQVIPTDKQSRSKHMAQLAITANDVLNLQSDFPERQGRNEVRQGRNEVKRGEGGAGDISHRSHRSLSPAVNRTGGRYRPADRSHSPALGGNKNRTGGYRDHESGRDDRDHSRPRPPRTDHHQRAFSPAVDEKGNIKVPTKETDFIPFTRTTDILDPSRAEDPLHLSRENTRVMQARKHYHENLRPADYGNPLDVYEDKQRQPAGGPRNTKNPILNPGLVKDHPTGRQDAILQQLSALKQNLLQRQRELETVMSPSDLLIEKQL